MKELDLEGHWPELLGGLDDEALHEVRQILATNWHEGWSPNKVDVTGIVKTIRGDNSVDEPLHSESATNASTSFRLMPDVLETWDSYLIPSTSTLKNLLGITDHDELRDWEFKASAVRRVELYLHPELVARSWDGAHVQAIHAHLFQDVYEWARQSCTMYTPKGHRTRS